MAVLLVLCTAGLMEEKVAWSCNANLSSLPGVGQTLWSGIFESESVETSKSDLLQLHWFVQHAAIKILAAVSHAHFCHVNQHH